MANQGVCFIVGLVAGRNNRTSRVERGPCDVWSLGRLYVSLWGQ